MTLPMIELREPTPFTDNRGSFTRLVDTLWDVPPILQVSMSRNTEVGTMRGMHSSLRSSGEFKVVSCMAGAISDFVIDLRPESPDYMKIHNFELTADEPGSILIPPGCAHGYVTREPDTRVLYAMSSLHNAETEIGFRWDDPILGIDWPIEPTVISAKDRALPLLTEAPRL